MVNVITILTIAGAASTAILYKTLSYIDRTEKAIRRRKE